MSKHSTLKKKKRKRESFMVSSLGFECSAHKDRELRVSFLFLLFFGTSRPISLIYLSIYLYIYADAHDTLLF